MKYFLIMILVILGGQNSYAQDNVLSLFLELKEGQEIMLSDKISSKEITKGSFPFIGISCYTNESEYSINIPDSIAYRIFQNSHWQEWVSFKRQHEGGESDRIAFEAPPILTDFDSLQYVVEGVAKSKIYFRAFIAQHSKTQPLIDSRSNCEELAYCDRICWCTDCPIDPSPEFTDPTHIIVHHSAGFNQSNDFASVVKYYYDLHVNTNGWDDIGYNWLIDANGVIYQGRPDGYQGAHFSCLNENTVGICMIGDFTSQTPTLAGQNTLIELIAYEATEHLIDVLGESYHVTGDFIIQNVSGHRDGNTSSNGCSTTACPGNSFYPLLNTIRNAVSELPCYLEVISSTEPLSSKEIVLYPNPAYDEIYISSNSKSAQPILLYNLAGEKQMHLSNNAFNEIIFLDNGMYLIAHGKKLLGKFIKL